MENGDYRYAYKLSGSERDWGIGRRSSPEKYRERLIKRFWAKVSKAEGQGPDGECWEWIGSRDKRGYGKIGTIIDGRHRPEQAHRVAFRDVYGNDLPDSHEVCHWCNNPPCVRNKHLWLGTHTQNIRHAQRCGRMPTAGPAPEPVSWAVTLSDRQRALLRQRRRERGIGFVWLCKVLEIDATILSKLETGKESRGFWLEKLTCLLRIVGISYDEFDFGECVFISAKYTPLRRTSRYHDRYSSKHPHGNQRGRPLGPQGKRGKRPTPPGQLAIPTSA